MTSEIASSASPPGPAPSSDQPASTPTASSSGHDTAWWKTAWCSVALALGYFTFEFFFSDYGARFELDSDEANNLMKALLTAKGFALGSEVWTDQPPLLTTLLSLLGRASDWSVSAARSLVLAFASLGLFAVADSARRRGGPVAAVAAAALLVSSARFTNLSVSVMIGLPAVACAALGLWALDGAFAAENKPFPGEGAANRRRARSVALGFALGGALLGVSVSTKLFTAFLVPLASLAVLVNATLPRPNAAAREPGPGATRLARSLRSLLPFGGAFLVSAGLGFAPLLLAGTPSGLVEGHLAAREAHPNWNFEPLVTFLRNDFTLFGAALVGVVFVATRRTWRRGSWWSAWLVLAFVVLARHHPVWPHHVTLLTLPAAMLGGVACGGLFQLVLRRTAVSGARRVGLEIGAMAGAALLVVPALLAHPDRIDAFVKARGWSNESRDLAVHRVFVRYGREARVVAAARPMHAFRIQKPIPPDQAVTSSKRFNAGLLDGKKIARDLVRYQAEVVLLSERWPLRVRREVTKTLTPTHVKVKAWPYQKHELWVEKKLAERLDGAREHSEP